MSRFGHAAHAGDTTHNRIKKLGRRQLFIAIVKLTLILFHALRFIPPCFLHPRKILLLPGHEENKEDHTEKSPCIG